MTTVESSKVILSPQYAISWSRMLRASRILPSALEARAFTDSSSIDTFSASKIVPTWSMIFEAVILLKSNRWHREIIVAGTF